MTKPLTLLLLFIGLAWGQDLKIANTVGDTVFIREGELLFLNDKRYNLKFVDYENQIIIADRKFESYSFDFLFENKKISFKSISSLQYNENRFNSIPLFIGCALGFYVNNKVSLDYGFNVILGGTIAGSGLVFSILMPTFSKKIILDDDNWSIVYD